MTYEESVQLRDKLRDYNAYDFKVRALTNFTKDLSIQSLKIGNPGCDNVVEYLIADDQKLIIDILTEAVRKTIDNYNKIMEAM